MIIELEKLTKDLFNKLSLLQNKEDKEREIYNFLYRAYILGITIYLQKSIKNK